MGTWFWYHLKANNALSLNMATKSAAYGGIFFYSPKKKKNEKYYNFLHFWHFAVK